tara:strand:+ start:756 stop:1178 length:423 start_codon:yes stop_codon:yes gene_type:complete
MKWLLLIGLFFIGCSIEPESDCGECGLEIYAVNLTEISPDHYELEYNEDLAQTYTMLGATTDCGWSRHLKWDTNYRYRINTDWVNLVNPGSMTDDDGNANVMFAAWEPFIGYTVKVLCGYQDECGVQYVDSLSISIVNQE